MCSLKKYLLLFIFLQLKNLKKMKPLFMTGHYQMAILLMDVITIVTAALTFLALP